MAEDDAKDQRDAVERYMRTHYVPSHEHDQTHQSVENRLTALDMRMSGLQTQTDAIDRTVNNIIARQDEHHGNIERIQAEQLVARNERLALLEIAQTIQNDVRMAVKAFSQSSRKLAGRQVLIGFVTAALIGVAIIMLYRLGPMV